MGVRDPKKTWFLTYPQCDVTKNALLLHLSTIDDIVEHVIAVEKHADGNSHLHAYVKFTKGVTLARNSEFNLPHHKGNYQPARSCAAVIKYCIKGGDYDSSFDMDTYLKKKGKVNATTIREKSVKTALEDGDISYVSARAYQYARSILQDKYDHTDTRGLWFYGDPGTGKSYSARMYNNDVYLKSQNKWWDGYEGEKTVILDDFDKQGIPLGHHLKIWTDRYACSGEIKGGTVNLCHERLIVTSNYSIDELWEGDSQMTAALNRRFRRIDFNTVQKEMSHEQYLDLINNFKL